MGLSTFDSFKRMRAEGTRELSTDDLRALQRTLVGILDDIASVCEAEGIDYALGGGSALGALRHGGFIPWDDDLDVNMMRSDWARFRDAFVARFGAKYCIHEPGSPRSYALAFPRIRLRGTSVVTREDLLVPDVSHGAFVDVFMFESTFGNGLLRRLHGLGSLALGFLYSCRKHFLERRLLRAWGMNSGAFRVKRAIGLCLAWLPMGRWTRLWDAWNGMCRNGASRFVTCPVGRRHFFGELSLRSEMEGTREMAFEGRKVRVPAGIERYMERLYGPDYRTPPPEEARERHVVFEPFRLSSEIEPTLRVIVASHKPYAIPPGDIYVPVQVGAAGKPTIPGFLRDDAEDGISERNPTFCELTGLYWAWKNLKADALGLAHYRRHFRGAHGIATEEDFVRLLSKHDVILPNPRNYWIETTYSQYVHAHHAADLDVTRAILAERHPGFVDAFDAVMKSTKGHRFNMFVMKRLVLDEYCAWLFDVLFELERRLDISSYSAYDARVFGFVGERLLDVWIRANGIGFAEMPVIHLEGQHWPTKVVSFLRRKFGLAGPRRRQLSSSSSSSRGDGP